ncbi:MAG TPA: MMPL family transporter [Stellaceae bacterium]|nr:MMPL family transporter [Stellaceae bacterium]
MTGARRWALAIWIAGIALAIAVIAHTSIGTDMSAFLPRSPTPSQQVLVDQVQNGAVSRLILLAIEGAPPDTLAALSKALAARLRPEPAFALVGNGEDAGFAAERDFLWRNRYVLSPSVTPERFTAAALRHALEDDLELLRGDASALVKRSLPADPTGEILGLIGSLAATEGPPTHDGVWLSADGRRAPLLVQTRALGFDIDAQQADLERIESDFAGAQRDMPNAGAARLLESGPAVFAVRARATMKRDASRFSVIATALVACVLLAAYRSPRLLLLSLVPVASGGMAGFAAVSAVFGFVHGITLGFGVTLIGESVDYAIYLFSQTAPGGRPEATIRRIWPTLRLGVATSICGFSAMLFSSFTGFAQLGLFSITGLLVAVSVTRWVLPALVPAAIAGVPTGAFARIVHALAERAPLLRWPLLALVLLAGLSLFLHRGGFWQEELSSLSPIPAAEQRLDESLRHDLGAPDLRFLVVTGGADAEQALGAGERLSGVLEALVAEKAIGGYDAPNRYLPSLAEQRARQDALPAPAVLRARLAEALQGLPFRPDTFAPFLADVATAKTAPPLTRADLPPAFALKLDSLLFPRAGGFSAVLPLRDLADANRVAAAVAAKGEGAIFVDLKDESDRLLQTYQHEALSLGLIGGLVIVGLLSLTLRSPVRVWHVVAPLAAAVILTAAGLAGSDRKLSIFNLVGLLLVVAVGSNYSLFFERQNDVDEQRDRTVASLVLANLSTVIGFGVLSLSGAAVLHDIGATVAAGAFLSLVFGAILSTGPRERRR